MFCSRTENGFLFLRFVWTRDCDIIGFRYCTNNSSRKKETRFAFVTKIVHSCWRIKLKSRVVSRRQNPHFDDFKNRIINNRLQLKYPVFSQTERKREPKVQILQIRQSRFIAKTACCSATRFSILISDYWSELKNAVPDENQASFSRIDLNAIATTPTFSTCQQSVKSLQYSIEECELRKLSWLGEKKKTCVSALRELSAAKACSFIVGGFVTKECQSVFRQLGESLRRPLMSKVLRLTQREAL